MMLLQEKMIARLTELCREDERLEAAMLYGSFTWGEADQYSDIDCLLYFADDRLLEIDPHCWLNQIAPVELYYKNEFGNHVAIFDNLVRGEFHFDTVSDMASLADYQGLVTFPSLEAVLLADKTDQLAEHLRPLLGRPPSRNTPQEIQFLCDSLINWTLFGLNVLERGEYARAWELLSLINDTLLRMARILEGQTQHWITPTKNAENELSPESYNRLVRCSAGVDPEQLIQAHWETWTWGKEMVAELANRHGLTLPGRLIKKIDRRLSA